MNWRTLYIVIVLASAATTIVLAGYGWRRRNTPGATAFAWWMWVITGLKLLSVLAVASHDPARKIMWSNFKFIVQTNVPILWLIFVFQYTDRQKWLSPRRLALLIVIPCLTLLLAFISGNQELISTSVQPDPWVRLQVVYSLFLAVLSIGLMAIITIRASHLYRQQAFIMLLGMLLSLTTAILNLLGLLPSQGDYNELDLTPIVTTAAGLVFAWGFFRYQLFDLAPVARATLIDSMSDGLLVLDRRNQIVDLNPALGDIIGIPPAKAIGQPANQVLNSLAEWINHPPDTSKTEVEVSLSHQGSFRHYDLRVSPLTDRRGYLTGRMIVLRDITERKQMEQNLEQAVQQAQQARAEAEAANQAKSTFLSMVNHELRTPLTSVLGFAKLINKRLDSVIFPLVETDDRRVQRAVRQVDANIHIIVSEGERLTALINDVLDLAKIESGKVEWNMQAISVHQVIERSAAATASLFAETPLELVLDVEKGLPHVAGDHDRLVQVMVNLISNAVKFTDEGSITCRARLQPKSETHASEIVVSVIDTGIGIPPSDHDSVFEQFVQVGDRSTTKLKGTGLGLPICKHIIEHHGGRLWLASDGVPGQGSTFSFALPVLAPEA